MTASGILEATTLSSFQWQFRDRCLWAVGQHSPAGGYDAINVDILGRLGIRDMAFGPGVSFYNTFDLNSHRFPQGTVISQFKADQVGHYRVCVYQRGLFQPLLGGTLDGRHDMLVVQMPGFERPAWLDEEVHADEHLRIRDWKMQAVQVSHEAKSKWGWCGDYERVMRGMGMI